MLRDQGYDLAIERIDMLAYLFEAALYISHVRQLPSCDEDRPIVSRGLG